VEDNFNVQQMDDLKGILVRCHASADTSLLSTAPQSNLQRPDSCR